MQKILLLLICGMFVAACNDNYISKKRDGLRPYPQEEDSRQAEEARE